MMSWWDPVLLQQIRLCSRWAADQMTLCLDMQMLQGLGELYEEEYVKANRPATDAVEERDAAVKAEARSLLKVTHR